MKDQQLNSLRHISTFAFVCRQTHAGYILKYAEKVPTKLSCDRWFPVFRETGREAAAGSRQAIKRRRHVPVAAACIVQ